MCTPPLHHPFSRLSITPMKDNDRCVSTYLAVAYWAISYTNEWGDFMPFVPHPQPSYVTEGASYVLNASGTAVTLMLNSQRYMVSSVALT